MATGIRKKLAKAVATGTGKHGKIREAAQKSKCVTADSKSAVKCTVKMSKEPVTSVGS
jgi:hypothetical protein